MLHPNGIKAIFFDLDGTLRTNVPKGLAAFAEQAIRLGLSISPADCRRAAQWEHRYFAGSTEVRADSEAFPDVDAFWLNYSRRQLEALGVSLEQAREMAQPLHAYMREQYHPQDALMPDVKETLGALKNAGYILGVVSNRDRSYAGYLDEIGLAEYFDFSLSAGEAQSWKPDKGIFEVALGKAKVTAAETVYVGDNYFADVVGARNAGLKPVLLDVDGLFEQPDCPAIRSQRDLLVLLEQGDIWSVETR